MSESERYQWQAPLAILLSVAGMALLLFKFGGSTSVKGQEVSYSEFVSEVRAGHLAEVDAAQSSKAVSRDWGRGVTHSSFNTAATVFNSFSAVYGFERKVFTPSGTPIADPTIGRRRWGRRLELYDWLQTHSLS